MDTNNRVDLINTAKSEHPDDFRKIRFKPTAYGWGLIFLLIWIPFTALATANNFLLIIFMMLVGTSVVSHVLGKKNVGMAEVVRKLPDEVFAGNPFTVKYHVKSSRPIWGSLTLQFKELSLSDEAFPLPPVPPNKSVERTHTFIIDDRGYRELLPGIIQSSFPFGMADYWKTGGGMDRILVYPKLIPIESYVPPWVGGGGTGKEKLSPAGTIPFSFREYMPGDSYKNIDWKKTAQAGSLVTRVSSDERADFITIRLESNASELAISKAASLVVHFEKLGVPIVFLGPGFALGPNRGKSFSSKILSILALWDSKAEIIIDNEPSGITVNILESGEMVWR